MDFTPEHYFQTATQRIRQAHYLFREGSSFALAIYVGGVAVECLLRAFKGRRDPTFDEKHDLLKLFAASGIYAGREKCDREVKLRHGAANEWREKGVDEADWQGSRLGQHAGA